MVPCRNAAAENHPDNTKNKHNEHITGNTISLVLIFELISTHKARFKGKVNIREKKNILKVISPGGKLKKKGGGGNFPCNIMIKNKVNISASI